MNITIAVGALPFYPTSTTLGMAKQAGADGVELLPTNRMLKRGAEHYARLSESHDIPIYSVHEPLRWRGYDITRHMRDAEETIAFAAEIPACDVVVLHFPALADGGSGELGRWLEAIDRARARCGNPNLRVTLENSADNHDKTPHQMLDDVHILRRVVGEWDLHLTFDVAHAASRGLDLVDTISTIYPRIANIHLSDARRRHLRGGLMNGLFRDHLVPGTGQLPMSEIICSLCQVRYNGLITLELSPASLQTWLPFQPQRLLKRSVTTIREDLAFGSVITEHADSPHRRQTR